jgi:hypothetical protein
MFSIFFSLALSNMLSLVHIRLMETKTRSRKKKQGWLNPDKGSREGTSPNNKHGDSKP